MDNVQEESKLNSFIFAAVFAVQYSIVYKNTIGPNLIVLVLHVRLLLSCASYNIYTVRCRGLRMN